MKNRFVEFIPDELEEGVLYVSMEHATVTHRCACGCGREVVTPLAPTDWQLSFDGDSVTLYPSIGNWAFPCRSHYFIRGGAIRWAGDMSQRDIDRGRVKDRAAKAQHYASRGDPATALAVPSDLREPPTPPLAPIKKRSWQSLLDMLFG